MIGDCRVEIVVGRRYVMPFCLGLLSPLFMHGPTFRPLLAPVLPALYTSGDTLKIVDIDPIGNKPGSPIIDGTLHTLVSCCHAHKLIPSFFSTSSEFPPFLRGSAVTTTPFTLCLSL